MKNIETPLFTELELEAMKSIVSGLYAELGFSDIDATDISKETKIPLKTIRGVLSSLVKKGLIQIEDNGAGFEIINLTQPNTQTSKDRVFGVQYHKEYAEECGLQYINLEAITTKKVVKVGNIEVGIISSGKPIKVPAKEIAKNNAKRDLSKLSYQQLAKMYGKNFVGKNKQELINLLTK